jgi:hypothetical protein
MLDDVRGVFVLGVVLEVGVEPVLDARSVARRHIRRVIDATVSAHTDLLSPTAPPRPRTHEQLRHQHFAA